MRRASLWILLVLAGCAGAPEPTPPLQVDAVAPQPAPPVVTITAPVAETPLYRDVPVRLSGELSDPDDDPNTVRVTWHSSMDGELTPVALTPDVRGRFEGRASLSEGTHVLTATGTDPGGRSATAEVRVEVGSDNEGPRCALTGPAAGFEVGETDAVTFTAVAHDPDGPDERLRVALSSQAGGALGKVAPAADGTVTFTTHGLAVGDHPVTLEVTDEAGAACTDIVQVRILEVPSVPGGHIGPTEALTTEDVRCFVDQPSNAPHEVDWTVDGEPFTATHTTEIPGDTVSSRHTRAWQRWTCSLTGVSGELRSYSSESYVAVIRPDPGLVVADDDATRALRPESWFDDFTWVDAAELLSGCDDEGGCVEDYDGQKVWVVGNFQAGWEALPSSLGQDLPADAQPGRPDPRLIVDGGEIANTPLSESAMVPRRVAVWGTLHGPTDRGDYRGVLEADLMVYVPETFEADPAR